MPLPDERPRQSVANLIGRFEHKKQPSGTVASPPLRSTSASSQITGDSAKEEVKEKKEWPPRSSIAVSPNTGDSAKEEPREKREWPPKRPSEETSISSSPPQRSPLSREPSQSTLPLDALLTQDAEAKPLQSSLDSKLPAGSNGPAVVPKLASSQSISTAPARTAAKTAKPVTKTAAKIPPSSKSKIDDRKTSAPSAAIAKPTSTVPGKQSRPSSRTATVRAKTPGNAAPPVPKTPSAKLKSSTATAASIKPPVSQAKTPSTSPPKQPSAGLYAPTAASLAKARNAQTPPEERKKALASSVSLDRLSKPTAASLSKIRKPPQVQSPPPRTRPASAKPSASTPSRTKPAVMKEAVTGGVAAAAVLQAQGTLETEFHHNGHLSEEDDHEAVSDSVVVHPNMNLSDLEGPVDHSVSYEGESQHAIEEPVESYDEEEHVPLADETSVVDPEIEVEDFGREDSSQEEIRAASSTDTLDSTSEPHQTDSEYQHDDELPEQILEPKNPSVNDIGELVNMLETTSFSSKEALEEPIHVDEVTKPASVVPIDQTGDIPDEE